MDRCNGISIVSVILFCIKIYSVRSRNANEIIENFINSSATTMTFISIDEGVSNSSSVVDKFHDIPKTILHFNTTSMKNCNNFANIDFYGKNISKFESNWKLEDILFITEFSDLIIFTPSKFIALILKCIVQPQSRYLLFVTTLETLETTSITHMLNSSWVSNGASKIFILQQDKVVTFNPFLRNDHGSYGKLIPFMVPFSNSDKRFRNLNGYPIKVELFSSTYTAARSKTAKSLDDFRGPDADVAKEISKVLNAKSMYDDV